MRQWSARDKRPIEPLGSDMVKQLVEPREVQQRDGPAKDNFRLLIDKLHQHCVAFVRVFKVRGRRMDDARSRRRRSMRLTVLERAAPGLT